MSPQADAVEAKERREVFATVILHGILSKSGPADSDADVRLAVLKADQLIDALAAPKQA